MNTSIISTQINNLNKILKNNSAEMTIEETLMLQDSIAKLEELVLSLNNRS